VAVLHDDGRLALGLDLDARLALRFRGELDVFDRKPGDGGRKEGRERQEEGDEARAAWSRHGGSVLAGPPVFRRCVSRAP
jgi:hypothetical protein